MNALLKNFGELVKKAQGAVNPFTAADLGKQALAAQQSLNIEVARELEALKQKVEALIARERERLEMWANMGSKGNGE